MFPVFNFVLKNHLFHAARTRREENSLPEQGILSRVQSYALLILNKATEPPPAAIIQSTVTPLAAETQSSATVVTIQETADQSPILREAIKREGSLGTSRHQRAAMAIMQAKIPFAEMSQQMKELVREAAPENDNKLQRLIEQNREMLTNLRQKGWTKLKGELQEQMEPYDTLRSACIRGVVDVLMETLKTMGHEPPGAHSATGTPGWNSDIDTVFLAPPDMPQQTQILEKALFDMVIFAHFGGLPGFIFDTESYTQQAGALYETQTQLETEEGAQLFARIELTAVLAQKLIQVEGVQSEEWKKLKENQIQSAKAFRNSSFELALQDMFADLESFYENITEGIRQTLHEQHLDPHDSTAIRLAMMTYKMRGLLHTSQAMDLVHQRLKKLEEENQPSQAMQRDYLRVKLGQLDLLRNLFFDEGYTTQGAFRKVCFLMEGQIHQRKIEDQQHLIRTHYRSQLQRRRSSKEMLPWSGGFKLHKAQKRRAVTQENLSSMNENLVLYLGHFQRAVRKSPDFQKALLSNSKYSYRTIQSAAELLATMSMLPNPSPAHYAQIKKLESQIDSLIVKISEQEKTKRAQLLNFTSTKTELLRVLGQNAEEAVNIVLKASEPAGIIEKTRLEESVLPEDRYILLFSRMLSQKLIKESGMDAKGLPVSDHPEVDHILKAHCGFGQNSESYAALLPYHKRSAQITLEAQQLLTPESIEQFNQQLEHVVTEVANLCIFYNIVPSPTNALTADLRLSPTWQQAIQSTSTGNSSGIVNAPSA